MPMAMWADRNNRRNLISFSVFLWSLMTALCAAATNFMQLLLLRIGVGVGEAGSNPPSHSMIADLYPPEKRSTAMAIFGTGINWGILIGFLVGGWINEWYGWRTAFVVVGLPGILLAILVRYTVKEPPRGYSEAIKQETPAPAFGEVVGFIWRSAVLRHIVVAGALVSFAGYASVIWVPIYLVRIHGMGTGEVGSYLALLIGVGGAIGIYFGGRIADFMAARRGQQWLPWVVAVSSLVTLTHALSDLYGDHAHGGDCRLCAPRYARHTVRRTGIRPDSEFHAVGNALGCRSNKSLHYQYHRLGPWPVHGRFLQ